MIWRLLVGGLWKPFAWLFGAAGLWMAGRRSASQAGKIKGLKSEVKAHERINEADLGIGASDADNIKWLETFKRENS